MKSKLKTKKRKTKQKVSKSFSGETTLKQLPDNTYFKTVGKDGKLSKSTYNKQVSNLLKRMFYVGLASNLR